jgi:hypothetical protein
VRQLHGHAFALAHYSTSKYPFLAASAQVSSSHGHPFSLAHCKTSKCPFMAAQVQVYSFHEQPLALAHCNTSKCPFSAAHLQVSSSHGHPFSLAHCNTSRWPFLAAFAQVISGKKFEPFYKEKKHLCFFRFGLPRLRERQCRKMTREPLPTNKAVQSGVSRLCQEFLGLYGRERMWGRCCPSSCAPTPTSATGSVVN